MFNTKFISFNANRHRRSDRAAGEARGIDLCVVDVEASDPCGRSRERQHALNNLLSGGVSVTDAGRPSLLVKVGASLQSRVGVIVVAGADEAAEHGQPDREAFSNAPQRPLLFRQHLDEDRVNSAVPEQLRLLTVGRCFNVWVIWPAANIVFRWVAGDRADD